MILLSKDKTKLFILEVIQKVATPPTDIDDEDTFLPQWAVAMITIGLLAVICVVLFGIAVVSFCKFCDLEIFNSISLLNF